MTLKTPDLQSAPIRAPEFPSGLDWLNTSQPLTLAGLRGKVVLLDFWTYCCVNCIHVLEELSRLEEEFSSHLVVIGVHSPKFSNEHRLESLRRAAERHRIRHPIVNDSNLDIWQSFAIRMWPTLVLIDPSGYLVGSASGEGHYQLLRKAIGKTIEVYAEAQKLDAHPFPSETPPETDTFLRFPGKVVADSASRSLFISDSGRDRVVMADFSGVVQDVIGSGERGFEDGLFERARFSNPQGVACREGTLYVADCDNDVVRSCDLSARTVTTIAGSGERNVQPGDWRISAARNRALNSPSDLCFRDTLLFIAMAGAHQIWLLDLVTGEIGPFAGSGFEGLLDGSLSQSSFAQPSGLSASETHLFVADSESSAIRAIPFDTSQPVMTVFGRGLFEFGDRDGKEEAVRLQHPQAVEFHDNRLFVADTYNHKLKVVDLDTRECRTLAGDGVPGRQDSRPFRLDEPAGLSASGDLLFVADTNNHSLRCLHLDSGLLETIRMRDRS